MVNKNRGIIRHRADYRKGSIHDCDTYEKNYTITPKLVVNIFGLGHLNRENDSEQLSSLPYRKKRNIGLSQAEMEYNKNYSKKELRINI